MTPTPQFFTRALCGLLLFIGVGAPTAAAQPTTVPSFTWASARFTEAMGVSVAHVSEILLHDSGRTLLVAYYNGFGARLAISTDNGASWSTQAITGFTQVRTMALLNDGSVLIGGSVEGRRSPLVRLRRVTLRDWSRTEWVTCGTGRPGVTLPLRTATAVWDIQVNAWGDAFIAAGAEENDPTASNEVVFRTSDRCETLMPVAELAAQSVLAMAIDPSNRLYAATSDTTEHDDPAKAGQTRIFYSDDHGGSWTETGRPLGAAKVYHLLIKTDGTLLAGTGISGGVYASSDRGATWTIGRPMPTAERIKVVPCPDGTEETVVIKGEVTRVYRMLELERGWILVGTGNDIGDLWLSPNNGVTWYRTTQDADDTSNVSWTMVKAADGTIWIGKGSTFGEIYRAHFIPPLWPVR